MECYKRNDSPATQVPGNDHLYYVLQFHFGYPKISVLWRMTLAFNCSVTHQTSLLMLPELLCSFSILCVVLDFQHLQNLLCLKSATGTTQLAWLMSPGPVLLRKHVRSNKYTPLVERVDLLHVNPQVEAAN
ncbi:uncharacterized protein LOC132383602 isoform X3 [Hypanus sabinus]|uniref:uncharacterized protein LOC132383602 isoform X3 n=1 Tax=Hypanus sabinus TaxID=79690 RepID=UPI0028C4E60F|nr:uncharacterized protein LOC132383602 isoform X3 [Hypanus sabinus]